MVGINEVIKAKSIILISWLNDPEVLKLKEVQDKLASITKTWPEYAVTGKFKKMCHIYWLYKNECVHDDDRKIHGLWTELYRKLGLSRPTAIEYRERARILIESGLSDILPLSSLEILSSVNYYDLEKSLVKKGNNYYINDKDVLKLSDNELEKEVSYIKKK